MVCIIKQCEGACWYACFPQRTMCTLGVVLAIAHVLSFSERTTCTWEGSPLYVLACSRSTLYNTQLLNASHPELFMANKLSSGHWSFEISEREEGSLKGGPSSKPLYTFLGQPCLKSIIKAHYLETLFIPADYA